MANQTTLKSHDLRAGRAFGERHAKIRYDVVGETRLPEWLPPDVHRVGAGTALRQES